MKIPYPTANMHVDVHCDYLEDQSLPMQHRYTFGYQIQIVNHSDVPLTIKRRYWQIVDDHNHTEIVEGDGVVGQQPTIAPQEGFVYRSGAQLTTPFGQMQGYYTVEDPNGNQFCVEIPAFLLSIPRTIH